MLLLPILLASQGSYASVSYLTFFGSFVDPLYLDLNIRSCFLRPRGRLDPSPSPPACVCNHPVAPPPPARRCGHSSGFITSLFPVTYDSSGQNNWQEAGAAVSHAPPPAPPPAPELPLACCCSSVPHLYLGKRPAQQKR